MAMRILLSTLLLTSFRPRPTNSWVIPCRRPSHPSFTTSKSRKSFTVQSMSSSSTDLSTSVHRVLCYGDSLTAGTSTSPWELYPYAPHLEQALNSKSKAGKSYVVRHRGMPGWTADAMVDAADDGQYGLRSAVRGIQSPSLSCVIIMAGTNDLGFATASPKDEQVSEILTPVKALHEMAWNEGVPRTIAIAIPPSGYQAQVSAAATLAHNVNEELKSFCESSRGKGVFVPFPFEYQRGGDNWSPDSLHFSPTGYAVLGKYMADPVLQVLDELDA